MNPWDLIVGILGWVLVVLLIVAVVFTVVILLVGLVYSIGRLFGAPWADGDPKP